VRLRIRGFKSIEEASLDLSRINVVIGPPESGKSNLLEALSIFTILGQLKNYEDARIVYRYSSGGGLWGFNNLQTILRIMTRVKRINDLFFRFVESIAEIELGGNKIELSYDSENREVEISLNGERVLYIDSNMTLKSSLEKERFEELSETLVKVMFYRYYEGEQIKWGNFLLPPHGPNLLHVLRVNPRFESVAAEILEDIGLKLTLNLETNEIDFWKFDCGRGIRIGYHLLSDTAKRILFNFGALETNENSVILMEEPEVHSFPFYTKLLAERVSLSKSNVFIVTTHNPYFLETILDKVPKHELSVYLARARGMRSEYESVDIDKMEEIIVKGADVFLELGGES
jgi:AAA15 family ATPase/GTPase